MSETGDIKKEIGEITDVLKRKGIEINKKIILSSFKDSLKIFKDILPANIIKEFQLVTGRLSERNIQNTELS